MGYKIKEIREAKHMTQTSLAKKSGVSRQQIRNIENGIIKDTKLSTLTKIAKALDTIVENLY